ncbi:hypothetical protein F5Y11DRAFT_365419 [Daldinia sp. FL1419]|nr:hypothetical protein F5Y11DRAFT_365419 [Daldinia sp. FL1419]
MDQMLPLDIEYASVAMAENFDLPDTSPVVPNSLYKLQQQNEELKCINSELVSLLKDFNGEMKAIKESLSIAKEELQSTRNHNAQLQGELSSIGKRRRANKRATGSDLERSQAAKILELEKRLGEVEVEKYMPKPFDTVSSHSSHSSHSPHASTAYSNVNTAANSRQGSEETHVAAKKESPDGLKSWSGLQMFQQPNAEMNQEGQTPEHMSPEVYVDVAAQGQADPAYSQFYDDQGRAYHSWEHSGWGIGYPQPQARRGIFPAYHQFYPGYRAPTWEN